MVHTRPDLTERWSKYYRLPTNQRRRLARAPHEDYEARVLRNSRRTIHPEQGMDIEEMRNPTLNNIINFQRWEQFITSPEPYDPVLVQEFYAAMMPPAFGEWSSVVVRGTRVTITKDDICRHYHVPRRAELDPTYGIPPIENVAQDEQYSPVIAASLRRNGFSRWFAKSNMIKKTELRPEIAILLRFVKCRLAPSTHYSTVNWYVGRILYCLQNNMLLDIGHIIVLHMIDAAAERCTGILPFPSLITKLCRDAGVRIEQTLRPPLPFDRTAYRAHTQSVDRIEVAGGDDNDDDVDDEEMDMEYDPAADEGEMPEDPRTIARIDRLQTHVDGRLDHLNRGVYNLSLLIRGQQVPDDAFHNPDAAGPSNPRPERQNRRRRQE